MGLGYCYNGDNDDEGTAGYNYDSDAPPPAIGVDFFRGPLADSNDGVDNDRDGEIDEPGEQIIMSNFVYYNNDFTDYGNPSEASHYYGYLKGIWKNGQPMTYGGTGYEPGNPECNFMFPDDTDTEFAELYGPWTEVTAQNTPNDRRFLQSAGPFTLEPGAVNYVTTGVVWARASKGDALSSLELLKEYDQVAQEMFDICFDLNQVDPNLFGCINPVAENYDPNVIYDDDSCIIAGCIDNTACNYDYLANLDDGSCEYCFYYSLDYPIIGVFNSTNSSQEEILSASLSSGRYSCISPQDTCFKNFAPNTFLVDNLSIDDFEPIATLFDGWISPIPDIDRYVVLGSQLVDIWLGNISAFLRPQDWIRSGLEQVNTNNEALAQFWPYSDISTNGTPMNVNGSVNQAIPLDQNQTYEFKQGDYNPNTGNAWLTPYMLVSTDYRGGTSVSTTTNVIHSIDTLGGGIAYNNWKQECSLDSLRNVDVILTPNKDLWTRCPVLDMASI